MPNDVYEALKEVGFEKYASELGEFMVNYDQDKEDKKAQKLGVQGGKRSLEDDDLNDLNNGEDPQIGSKRLKYEDEEEE